MIRSDDINQYQYFVLKIKSEGYKHIAFRFFLSSRCMVIYKTFFRRWKIMS